MDTKMVKIGFRDITFAVSSSAFDEITHQATEYKYLIELQERANADVLALAVHLSQQVLPDSEIDCPEFALEFARQLMSKPLYPLV